MKIGVDYYPEQWDESLWSTDAEIMAKTGVKKVRLAGFSWAKLEPEDGVFDFSWLDEVISDFSNFGIEIMLCTPICCPPLWLIESHPEITRVEKYGTGSENGAFIGRCINSPVFLEYAKRITEEMARHYASWDCVKAWQIDNGLDAFPCCCDSCSEGFAPWLLDKYETLENINDVYGDVSGSGGYTSSSQIKPPSAYPLSGKNPALSLDYYRYMNDCLVRYIRIFAEIIHRHCPKAAITANLDLGRNKPDLYRLYDELDVVSFSNFPQKSFLGGKEKSCFNTMKLDLARGIKDRNFWIVDETASGGNDLEESFPTPIPNMISGYSLQAFAHGADTVMHFRWRTAVNGTSVSKQGILDRSSTPNRRFFEFSELCKTVSKLNVLAETRIISDIAILYSPESEFSLSETSSAGESCYAEQLRLFYAAFSKYGANIDIVSPKSDLSGYKIVVAPMLYVNDKDETENIYRYTMAGGTLILTNGCGVRDKNNNYVTDVLPGVYKELVGAELTEYDNIGDFAERRIVDFAGNEFACHRRCDILKLNTARAYAEYADSFYRCCPAVTLNEYCDGVVYYLGTVCDEAFYNDFAGKVMKQNSIPRLRGLPDGVEVTTRTNGNDDFIFFFNNSAETVTIGLPKAMYSILDSTGKDRIELKPFEADVVRK